MACLSFKVPALSDIQVICSPVHSPDFSACHQVVTEDVFLRALAQIGGEATRAMVPPMMTAMGEGSLFCEAASIQVPPLRLLLVQVDGALLVKGLDLSAQAPPLRVALRIAVGWFGDTTCSHPESKLKGQGCYDGAHASSCKHLS